MSIGPMGLPGSLAGVPLSQAQGGDVDRNQQADAAQTRQSQSSQKAESAAGIGATTEDEQSSDRDADGRRLWEKNPQNDASSPEDDPQTPRPSNDPTGNRGANLDLTG